MGLAVQSAGGPGCPSRPLQPDVDAASDPIQLLPPLPAVFGPLAALHRTPAHDVGPTSRSPSLDKHRAWGTNSLTGES